MAESPSQPLKNNSRAQLLPSNDAFLPCASLPHSYIHMYKYALTYVQICTQMHKLQCTHVYRHMGMHMHTTHIHAFMPTWTQNLSP